MLYFREVLFMIAIFTVIPVSEGESISPYVTKVIEEVDKSGLDYKLTAMGTLIEGPWDKVMDTIKKCHNVMRRHSSRVLTSITIDDRKGAKKRLDGKVQSVVSKSKRAISV
jgi:uncharacterized protein (TIGR00106 family)